LKITEVGVAVDEHGRFPSQWECEVWGNIFELSF